MKIVKKRQQQRVHQCGFDCGTSPHHLQIFCNFKNIERLVIPVKWKCTSWGQKLAVVNTRVESLLWYYLTTLLLYQWGETIQRLMAAMHISSKANIKHHPYLWYLSARTSVHFYDNFVIHQIKTSTDNLHLFKLTCYFIQCLDCASRIFYFGKHNLIVEVAETVEFDIQSLSAEFGAEDFVTVPQGCFCSVESHTKKRDWNSL